MNMNSVSGGLIIVSLVLCYLLVVPVSAEYSGDSLASQFISSSTSIAATGEVNESVSLKMITHDGLITEKKEWLSSVTRTGSVSGSWSSSLLVSHENGPISWNYYGNSPFGSFSPFSLF
jgi:hypothetical protein